MFKKITEYFIPKARRELDAELRSERIFVAVLLISALSNFLGINLAVEIGAKLNGQLLLLNGIINLIILFAYRFGLPKFTAASIFLTQYAISFPLQAWLQGGLLSPASAAFFLLPSVAMLILGKKPAVFWMIVSALLSVTLLVLELNVGSPEPEYDLEKKQLFYFSSILGTNLTIFLILLVYELGKSRALQNLHEKHKALKDTQTQLIQQEKLASLGELTAGIAHEIQNPLNFVNNFSELGNELIDELIEERLKSRESRDELMISEILEDLRKNLVKINYHGKRADSIVKGMLDHSRANTGEKKPTNINLLAEEFIRLSYHGLRAKDKTFQANFDMELAQDLPSVKAVSQDIGRVILNLVNNAFDAVHEKSKSAGEEYQPHVKVSTQLLIAPGGYHSQEENPKSYIQLTIADNGGGIPKSIQDKIFQPFFTTKPTGSGTGLGLSISYDIVKAHGGELRLNKSGSKLSTGTEFMLILPVA
ncbi:ATP-binding protein [Algoriphagus halophytocola]|uniref:histidine kinase n=1 Tax=Algoriphagus halophytocola TaxID=2991499 RepID=A0ABY6MGR5_9BACT|nr:MULTISPECIES: ATP-binding protein [unclassified Algoriphagus]UZD21384.1 ATP-binding protein [Algoriphagus sp. TR-M5]WBL42596.1 ATP-binding protein [Algoriphagus sp. TR-M9]